MVTVTLRLEFPDWASAARMAGPLEAFGEQAGEHGAQVAIEFGDRDGGVCRECGSPMVYEPALGTHVCHHDE